jgi:hypothetical protein
MYSIFLQNIVNAAKRCNGDNYYVKLHSKTLMECASVNVNVWYMIIILQAAIPDCKRNERQSAGRERRQSRT